MMQVYKKWKEKTWKHLAFKNKMHYTLDFFPLKAQHLLLLLSHKCPMLHCFGRTEFGTVRFEGLKVHFANL